MPKRFLLTIVFALFVSHSFSQNRSYNLNGDDRYTLEGSVNSDVPSLRNSQRHREFLINPVLQQADVIQKNDTIILDLFEDCNYEAYVTGISTNVNGTMMINGRLEDYKFSSLFISTSEGKSYIQIDIPEKEELYAVNYMHDQGTYYLKQLEYNKYDMNSKGIISPAINEKIRSKNISQNNLRVTDEQVTIKLLVTYTSETIKWSNENATSISNVINIMMARNQLVLDNSQTNVKLELAAAVRVNYTEQDSMDLDLHNFINNNDGYMDEVHTLRDYYYADAMLFISGKTYWGAGKGCLFSGNTEWAGAVVDSWGAVNLYSPIHEIGHILGAHHQKNIVDNPSPDSYNYGWGWHDTKDNGYYCTVMSYRLAEYWPDSITRIVVPHFSNPNVKYNEVATGVANAADNARRIRETKSIVADFRVENCAHPSTPTVSQVIQPDCNSDIGSITLSNLPNDSWKLLILPIHEVIPGNGASKTIKVRPGEMSFAVIDSNRCPSMATGIISIEKAIATTPKIDEIIQPTCDNKSGSVEISNLPVEGVLIIHSRPGNGIVTDYTDPLKLDLVQGTYSFSAKSKAGCSSPATEMIEINAPPKIPSLPDIKVIHPGCNDRYGTLEFKNLPSEAWEIYKTENTKETKIASGSTATTSIEILPGSYDIFIKLKSGCSSENTHVVINPPEKPGAPLINVLSQPSCTSDYGKIEISNIPSVGELRFYGDNSVWFRNYDKTPYTSNLNPGSYSIAVKDKSGCISDRSEVVINDIPYLPPPDIRTVTQPTCKKRLGRVLIDNLPDNGILITHSIDGDKETKYITSREYKDLEPGNYSFSVRNSSGCTSDKSNEVIINNQPVLPEILNIDVVQPGCNEDMGVVKLTGMPSGFWEIYEISVGFLTSGSSATVSIPLGPGTYKFLMKNSDGCHSKVTEEVDISLLPTPPVPVAKIISQPTCHKGVGKIHIGNLPSGSWELLQYLPEKNITLLSGKENTAELELPAGDYSFKSKNEHGCTSEVSNNIQVDNQPVIVPPVIKIIRHPNCSNPAGSISVSDLPEDAWTLKRIPDDKEFTGSGSEATIDDIPAGRYSFNVTNSEACTSKNSKYIDLFQISLIPQPTITQNGLTLSASPADSYQWYLSNEPIEGATKKDFTVVKEGEYHVVVYDDQCYSKPSDKLYITINGIGDIKTGLKVYPNPAYSELSLELPGNNEPVYVDIFSVSGELFYSSEFTNLIHINVKQWPSGVYFIKSFNNKLRLINKFVKN